jgi:MFS superfamily sulfate permease-like transporter
VLLLPTESGTWKPQILSTGAQALPGLIVYRFTHSLYYANCQQLASDISELVNAADPPLRRLCIEASAIDDIDYTAAETLRSLLAMLRSKKIDLAMCNVSEDVKSRERRELSDVLGGVTFYDTLDEMIVDYRRKTGAAVM